MARQYDRIAATAYSVKLLTVNDDGIERSPTVQVENISKGGFRFTTGMTLQLEDRLRVVLRFPDGHSQKVLGRICYCEPDDFTYAYGFSVLEGFYRLGGLAA